MSSFRTLLMPLGVAGQAAERITGALAVARHFQAHVDVLFTYVSPKTMIPEDIFGMSKSTMDSLTQAADQHAAAQAKQRKQLFLDLCQRHGVPVVDKPSAQSGPTAAWHDADGLRSSLVARRGRLADLIIVARSSKSGPSALIRSALTETGRPVLLMPRTYQTFAANNIVIGWNGSVEVAHALDAALPCMTAAASVTVATTGDHEDESFGGATLLDYLAWHGIQPKLEILNDKSRSVGEALLAHAKVLNADLLVVGAYSRRHMRELIVGSVTQHVLASAELPVLMAH